MACPTESIKSDTQKGDQVDSVGCTIKEETSPGAVNFAKGSAEHPPDLRFRVELRGLSSLKKKSVRSSRKSMAQRQRRSAQKNLGLCHRPGGVRDAVPEAAWRDEPQ